MNADYGGEFLYDDITLDIFHKNYLKEYLLPYLKGATYFYGNIKDFGYKNGIPNNCTSCTPSLTTDRDIVQLSNGVVIIYVSEGNHSNGCRFKQFFIDLNGPKLPNELGNDIHSVYWGQDEITKTMSWYLGTKSSFQLSMNSQLVTCQKIVNGAMSPLQVISCTLLIAKNNWKIPNNYPIKF